MKPSKYLLRPNERMAILQWGNKRMRFHAEKSIEIASEIARQNRIIADSILFVLYEQIKPQPKRRNKKGSKP